MRPEFLAAEPQPQAFDPDWYPYRKIRECKRKTSLFFYHVIPTDITVYVSDKIFRFPGRNLKPLHVSAKGIPDPKWSLYVSRKKFVISESRLIEGKNIMYNVLEQMGKLLRFKYTIAFKNFPHLLGFLKITCDLISGSSRRTASAIRGTVFA